MQESALTGKNHVLKIIDALYIGESRSKINEVRSEVEAYLSSGADDVFFSIVDQALMRAIRDNIDELMPKFASLVVENGVNELGFIYVSELVIQKAQMYLTDLDMAEQVDLGRSVRILNDPEYRSAVIQIIIEKFETLTRLLESRGVNVVETYGQPALGSGQDYEHFVSRIFVNNGWETEITKGSGDQGADIIGTYQNQRFVVQCKFYSGSVGNKAVQEVHAAKSYYRADRAVVVSNANYTKSASELAGSLDVLLLHHQDIEQFIHHLDAVASS